MVIENGSDKNEALVSSEEMLKNTESLTIDQVVDKIYKGPTLKLFVVFWTAVACNYVNATETIMTTFTGYIPYKEWTCVSEKCKDLLVKANYSDEFYSQKSMCDNSLVAGIDFNWTSERTFFSVDWGIYCSNESKLSLASSIYFIGALLGLLSSTAIYDKFGRRNGTILGCFIASVATLVAVWAPNYEFLLFIRVVQGYGQFMSFTGVYCWSVEFAPSHLRCHINTATLFAWNIGFLLMVCIAYYIKNWQYIFLATAIINFVVTIPLFIYPISPRFALVRGRDKEAKEILEKFSRICNNEINMDSIDLVYKDRVQNYWKQLKDFKTYPNMLKRQLLGCGTWFLLGALFYGFNFGWSKIGKDLYTAYLCAAAGNTIGFIITTPVCNLVGRRRSILLFFGIGILSNLLAMPDVNFSPQWTLNHVACLIGSIAILCAFLIMYLFTSELAPTSHRGMMLSLCSSCARIGSFIGPFSNDLRSIKGTVVTLAVFCGATIIAAIAVFFLPDTTGRRIAEIPSDLGEGRRAEYHKVEDEEVKFDGLEDQAI